MPGVTTQPAATQTAATQPVDPLVAAACAKAGLVWVRAPGAPEAPGAPGTAPQPVWHVWHADAVLLVVGGDEQRNPVPEGVGSVEVQVPSKDNRALLVTFPATVERLDPADPEWEAAVFRLQAGRLNAPDTATLAQRWAQTSTVLRLRPAGEPAQAPGRYDQGSGAVQLERSPATTVTWHPFHVGGRSRRRRYR